MRAIQCNTRRRCKSNSERKMISWSIEEISPPETGTEKVQPQLRRRHSRHRREAGAVIQALL